MSTDAISAEDPASGTGAFHTPKEIIDFVTANPPLGAEKPAWKPLDIHELGISFKRFYSTDYEMFVAGWNNGNDSHVYMLTVERVREDWFAIGHNDGREVFRLSTNSKDRSTRCGLAAMRAYLITGHRRTWTKRHGDTHETEGGAPCVN